VLFSYRWFWSLQSSYRRRAGCGKGHRRPDSVLRMTVPAGAHRFGPDNASLQVRTYREGVAAKAGHDLIIDVTRWEATVEVADEPAVWSIELSADPRSLEVREGLRGVKPLTDKDRVEIRQNIDSKVLGSHPIRFRSRGVRLVEDDDRVTVEGELTIAGSARPLTAQLIVKDDGTVSGTIPLTQTDWNIRPYRGLMGALKVRDEVEVVIAADLPSV
jgi:polyisoprenoid-binding protein YceI